VGANGLRAPARVPRPRLQTITGGVPDAARGFGALPEPTALSIEADEIAALDPSVSPELAVCVQRLVTPAPERRFASVDEVAPALAEARGAYTGPQGAAAMAATVAVLGTPAGASDLAVLGDGRDGTREPVTLYVTETN
jgi:hypothetical protein